MAYNRQTKAPYKPLGKKVAELRQSLGWSQGELADLAEYSQANISHIEAHRGNITIPKLLSLCKTLKTDPNTLLCWDEYLKSG